MNCPYCTASLPDGSRLCQFCGRLLASSAPPQQPPGSRPGQPDPGFAQPGGDAQSSGYGQTSPHSQFRQAAAGPNGRPPYPHDPYSHLFDPSSLSPEQHAAYRTHRFHATSSVLMSIILHVITFGTLSWFLVARKHAFLPHISPGDFSAGRAAGFLFIPFFSLYWFFVLLRRTSDRLTFQTKLWGVGKAPSKGLATTLAILTALAAIPYLGLLFFPAPYLFVWPFYLSRMQAACNALALRAAPESARSTMLQLERWARLRWLGWLVLAPAIVVITSAAGVLYGSGQVGSPESVIAMTLFAIVAAGGGAMLYAGSHQTRGAYHALSEATPHIVAGYLRIDKNAAWTSFWVSVVIGLISLIGGVGGLTDSSQPSTPDELWGALGQAVGFALLAAYALYKGLQLREQIRWLESSGSTP